MSRTTKSIKNLAVGTAGHMLHYLVTFIARRVFVMVLAVEYLGLNGLFTNILSMLSLMELGIGGAISFSLYKPLAFGEKGKIKALMQFYKKAYSIIGALVLGIGLLLLPVLPFLIGEDTSIVPHIGLIYALFVINSAASYLVSYKRTILIADQKSYIDNIYHYGFQILLSVSQMVVLLLTKNYILFLLVMIAMTILENFIIGRRVNREYPYLKDDTATVAMDADERVIIKKNVFALTLHKIGSVAVNGTDNILIVKFVSLASAGLYSNYLMITNALGKILNILYNSLTASVGNLVAEKDAEASRELFEQIQTITYWIFGFCSISLMLLFNPFITLWLGPEFTFKPSVVFVIALNFYLTGMLKPVRTFYSSMGLFWYDRYKPLFEAGINLFASIVLAKKFGLIGVLIGTTISSITTICWFEPYVLFRFGFRSSVVKYFLDYILHGLITLLIGYLSYRIASIVKVSNNLTMVMAVAAICIFVSNAFYLAVFALLGKWKSVMSLLRKAIRAVKERQ